jgi:serine/threonine protein kinase
MVAVKLLSPVMNNESGGDYLRAFREEAQVVASLNHPHILPIHDYGEFTLNDDVVTYLVMPLITGGTLRDRIRGNQGLLPIGESLIYLQHAAEAIDYAYQMRIIHRDIKPGNMLLQDGWLFLSDFGLARLLSTNTYRSRTGVGAGTPEYMAPEQIRGRAVAASDRYSLAILAYQLLTGSLPFQDEEPFTVFLKHLREAPVPPRKLNPHLPEVAERAIMKSLAKKPAERHLSCRALVEEIAKGWDTDSLQALIGSDQKAPYLLSGASQPTKTLLQTGAAQASMTPRITPPSLQEEKHKQESQQKMPSSLSTTPSRLEIGRRALLIGGTTTAMLAMGGGLALASGLLAPRKNAGPHQLMAGKPLVRLTRNVDAVRNVCWHPQGRYLVTTAGPRGGLDGEAVNHVQLWDSDQLIGNKQTTADLPARDWVVNNLIGAKCIGWSSDGRQLGLTVDGYEYKNSTWYYALTTIDVFTKNSQPEAYIDKALGNDKIRYTSLAWSPKGGIVATLTHPEGTDRPQGVALWDPHKTGDSTTLLENPEPETMMDLKFKDIIGDYRPSYDEKNHCLCWSCDGARLLAQDNALNIGIWDVNSAALTSSPPKLHAPMQKLVVPDRSNAIPNGKQADVPVQLYFPTVIASPTDAALFATNDLDLIVIGDSMQRKVQSLLRCENEQALRSVTIGGTHYYPQVGALAWSPNGRYIAGTYLSSQEIFVWDLHDPHPHKNKDGHQLPLLSFGATGGHSHFVVTDLAWSPDGRYLASSSFDTTAIIWQIDKNM